MKMSDECGQRNVFRVKDASGETGAGELAVALTRHGRERVLWLVSDEPLGFAGSNNLEVATYPSALRAWRLEKRGFDSAADRFRVGYGTVLIDQTDELQKDVDCWRGLQAVLRLNPEAEKLVVRRLTPSLEPQPCSASLGTAAKPVIAVEDGKTYPSISEAARDFGAAPSGIRRAIANGSLCKGCHWKLL